MSTHIIASGLTPGRFLAVEAERGHPEDLVELRVYDADAAGGHELRGNIHLNEDGAGNLVQAILSAFGSGAVTAYLRAIAAREGLEITLKPKPPVWCDEDVVIVNYSGHERICFVSDTINDLPVTDWFGDTHPLSWLDERYREGHARLVLRHGKPVTP